MKTKSQIRLDGTDVIVHANEIYYLSNSTDSTLCNYLIKGVLSLNFHSSEKSKPLSIFIGDHDVINSVNKALQEIPSGAMGGFCFFNEIGRKALTAFIHEQLLNQSASMVILYGFNEIRFSSESVLKHLQDIDRMLHSLRKLQSEFGVPILLAGTTKIKHDDDNRCIPAFSSRWPEVEITSNACYDIKIKKGYLKLFHLPKENPAPSKPLSPSDLDPE
jgi:hypothetical protein